MQNNHNFAKLSYISVILGLTFALVLSIVATDSMLQQIAKSKTVSINCSNNQPCQRTVCENSKCETTAGDSFGGKALGASNSTHNTNDTTSTTLRNNR
jgi:hypothetical protein